MDALSQLRATSAQRASFLRRGSPRHVNGALTLTVTSHPPPAVPLGPIPQQGIMREAATRAALKQLRKRGSGKVETGFATYTADIAAGWHTELASWRFRQAVLAEFLGTAIFVCILVCAVIFYPLGYDEEVGGSARG